MLIAVIGVAGCSDTNDAPRAAVVSSVPNPIVTQVAGGRVSGGLRYDVTAFGYREQEYFFEVRPKPSHV
ncbi:MAG: hypothetical protein IPG06_13525 [Haliea sp.]|nr:hypothetical protein [Haliea sp.]